MQKLFATICSFCSSPHTLFILSNECSSIHSSSRRHFSEAENSCCPKSVPLYVNIFPTTQSFPGLLKAKIKRCEWVGVKDLFPMTLNSLVNSSLQISEKQICSHLMPTLQLLKKMPTESNAMLAISQMREKSGLNQCTMWYCYTAS